MQINIKKRLIKGTDEAYKFSYRQSIFKFIGKTICLAEKDAIPGNFSVVGFSDYTFCGGIYSLVITEKFGKLAGNIRAAGDFSLFIVLSPTTPNATHYRIIGTIKSRRSAPPVA